jgi:WD40 repeat protein
MHSNAVEVAPRPESVVTAVAWSPNSGTLAIGHADGAVQVARIDDPLAGRLLRESGEAAITSVAWNPRGDSLAFGSAAGECGVIEVSA